LPIYVEVAVNIPGRVGTFDYHLPEDMAQAAPGSLVVVPFGKQRVQGVILRHKETPSVMETRAVEALLDERPVITAQQMRLAQWLAHETLAPLSACIDLMLPPGLSQLADREYRLNPAMVFEVKEKKPLQQRIMAMLIERGPLRGRQFEAAFPRQRWKEALQTLVRKGILLSRPVLPEPDIRPRTTRMVGLAVTPQEIVSRLDLLGKVNSAAYKRRKAVLEFLAQELTPIEATWVYAQSGANASDLRRLFDLGLVRFHETEVWRDPLSKMDIPLQQAPTLTQDQVQVWEHLLGGLRHRESLGEKPYLLHGVTGSGKTEIYLRAVAEVLAQGRQAIVLVPEIALTPQTVQRFLARFPGQVGLVHSRLSPGERFDTWRRARSGQIKVIVGARSALFTPLPNPGLIVMDECHDPSYYQSEPAPAYRAVQAAITYGKNVPVYGVTRFSYTRY
jgi:primosomal protein N' (replication factor Y) (superfamily II helicase)